jgi:hypothetical protein
VSNVSVSPSVPPRGHRVREFVCTYRPLRDSDGRIVDVPAVTLKDPRTAAAVLSALIADQPVCWISRFSIISSSETPIGTTASVKPD